MDRSPSFPNLLMSFIESIPDMMENNTSGATMNFSKLRKITKRLDVLVSEVRMTLQQDSGDDSQHKCDGNL